MDEIGVVKSISGHVAIVSVARKSACDQCRAGCTLTGSDAEIETLNKAGASVGQKVRVEMKPYSYFKGSLLVYGIPALALIAGAMIGKEYVSPFFPGSDPDIVSAVSGFGAFILSFILVKIWSAGIGTKTDCRPVIEEILDE